MADLRVGLAGFGLAGRAFHGPLIEAVDGLRLAAVATSRRDEVAEAHPEAEVVASIGDLWERADVVVVAAPNRVHVEIGLDAVRRGIPVIVDKPLATSAGEAERLVAEAARQSVPLTVFHNRRWDGDFLTARRLISDGALGDVVRFESRFERFRPQVTEGVWRERADPAEGGGVLLDLGPHLVDQALVLFGPVSRSYAEVRALRHGAQVDDDAFLVLEHESGVSSHLAMSAVAPLHGPRLAISGLRAGFATDGVDPQEAQLRSGVRPGDPEFGRAEHPGRLVGAETVRDVELDRGDYPAFYEGVVAWLREGAPPPVDPAEAVEGLRILERARRGESP